jgi:hypothetical protein
MRLPHASSRALVAFALILASLALPSAAPAAWFPAETIDGPGGDVVALGGVDLARDGTGAVVYLRREGGVPHVFLSRVVDGAFRAPERVDVGLDGAATAATVAAGDDRRLAVAFVSGGKLYGSFAPGDGRLTPLSPPQMLVDGSPDAPVTDPHADLGVNGTAYVVYGARGDVGAVRLETTVWEAVTGALDVAPAQTAGAGASRPRVAVSAEGNAVATWGEESADGRRRVYGRRITGLVTSVAPQEISLPELPGAGAGGPADSPDIDIEDDGSYAWVGFRQDFGGVSRTVARRLVGSLFEAPFAIDSGQPSTDPTFDLNGRGVGATAAAGPGGSVFGALLDITDTLSGFGRLDSVGGEGSAAPAIAVSERRTVGLAWRARSGGVTRVVARRKPDDRKRTGRPVVPFEAETTLSVPEFGSVVGVPEISTTKNGEFAVVFLQGDEQARRLVAAVWDVPPGRPAARNNERFGRRRQPLLAWRPGGDLWGGQIFKVFLNGIEIATTDRLEQRVPGPLPDGVYTWAVQAIDRRGQTETSRPRRLRIDGTPPAVRVRVSGSRRAGRRLVVAVTVDDGKGSGTSKITVDYGDRTAPSALPRSVHRYRRPGTYTLRVRVSDKARNVTRETVRLRIGR